MEESILTALATHRLTKLVIDDYITADIRDKAFEQLSKLKKPYARKIEYLLTCPWCVSIWAAGFLILLSKVAPDLTYALKLLLASSSVTGILLSNG